MAYETEIAAAPEGPAREYWEELAERQRLIDASDARLAAIIGRGNDMYGSRVAFAEEVSVSESTLRHYEKAGVRGRTGRRPGRTKAQTTDTATADTEPELVDIRLGWLVHNA